MNVFLLIFCKEIHIRNLKPMKIADVKLLKNKYGVTFNDVITCLTVSGIRKYILSQDNDFFKKNPNPTMTALLAFGMYIEYVRCIQIVIIIMRNTLFTRYD